MISHVPHGYFSCNPKIKSFLTVEFFFPCPKINLEGQFTAFSLITEENSLMVNALLSFPRMEFCMKVHVIIPHSKMELLSENIVTS